MVHAVPAALHVNTDTVVASLFTRIRLYLFSVNAHLTQVRLLFILDEFSIGGEKKDKHRRLYH